jgi:hypothetical protein
VTNTFTSEEQAWIARDAALRDEARAIALETGRDEHDIYRTLKQMLRTPSERLRLGLAHARLHPKYR